VLYTIELTSTVVLVSLVLGLVIALLLDRVFFGRGIVRTLMIAPFLIVPVAAALLFKHGIYNPNYGLLNGTLTAIWNLFGGHAPQPDWLTAREQSKVAMCYAATASAGSPEAKGSPVAGKIGYAQAPVVQTKTSGWLYAWSWAIEKASGSESDAWKFVSWASSKAYEELVGQKLGWASVPAGKRASTYANPDYLQVAKAFAKPTLTAISSANPTSPGVQPRPTIGIQFVDIPEFTDFGTKASQEISAAIAGQESVASALKRAQSLASAVGDTYR